MVGYGIQIGWTYSSQICLTLKTYLCRKFCSNLWKLSIFKSKITIFFSVIFSFSFFFIHFYKPVNNRFTIQNGLIYIRTSHATQHQIILFVSTVQQATTIGNMYDPRIVHRRHDEGLSTQQHHTNLDSVHAFVVTGIKYVYGDMWQNNIHWIFKTTTIRRRWVWTTASCTRPWYVQTLFRRRHHHRNTTRIRRVIRTRLHPSRQILTRKFVIRWFAFCVVVKPPLFPVAVCRFVWPNMFCCWFCWFFSCCLSCFWCCWWFLSCWWCWCCFNCCW